MRNGLIVLTAQRNALSDSLTESETHLARCLDRRELNCAAATQVRIDSLSAKLTDLDRLIAAKGGA